MIHISFKCYIQIVPIGIILDRMSNYSNRIFYCANNVDIIQLKETDIDVDTMYYLPTTIKNII